MNSKVSNLSLLVLRVKMEYEAFGGKNVTELSSSSQKPSIAGD